MIQYGAPMGSASKCSLVEMVKDDGACACNIEIAFDCGGDEKIRITLFKGFSVSQVT